MKIRPEKFDAFYRVSVKALIFDETKTKFLIIKEDNGWWELPGGGLDNGEDAEKGLRREVKEEIGLEVIEIDMHPAYFLIGKSMSDQWSLNLVFETKVKDLNFTPTEEGLEIKFVTPEDAKEMQSWRNVKELADKLIADR
jgi:8-oxo-dGTP diphosphatase